MQALVIDAFSFCQQKEQREGSAKLADFPRLAAESANADAIVNWSLSGGTNQLGHPKLTVSVSVTIELMCQRCLTPFEFEIDSQSELILAKNEEHADEIEEMLEDDEVDVVVGSKTFNIMDVVEDEALLAIPQSPKHAVCPDVGSFKQSEAANNVEAADSASTSGKVSPFAVLKKLQ
ncbi:DUF177 domain-containing protein [Undibacterium cyanobacteriorum]|uniref:Large ribosomal RNA subunit accumulation protein YceD n=1 Tax=Undibacterium cyanobacteriorum TaxID=3073561 RepID=A0ABY9RNY8_9BURK|nr:DUF177 domain-containing protein [Undibacterium sp. 20NA77.5]WMW82395.1 DUF177 domain-containing protein [Undibacterium sp. 20NA77.5]